MLICQWELCGKEATMVLSKKLQQKVLLTEKSLKIQNVCPSHHKKYNNLYSQVDLKRLIVSDTAIDFHSPSKGRTRTRYTCQDCSDDECTSEYVFFS